MNRIIKAWKILSLFLVAVLLASCESPTGNNNNSNNDNNQTPPPSEIINAGWYVYTTNADSDKKQITYLYIDENGNIERAGSTENEYTGTHLEMFTQLSYSICMENAENSNKITFTPCEAPNWTNTPSDEDVNNNDQDNPTTITITFDANYPMEVLKGKDYNRINGLTGLPEISIYSCILHEKLERKRFEGNGDEEAFADYLNKEIYNDLYYTFIGDINIDISTIEERTGIYTETKEINLGDTIDFSADSSSAEKIIPLYISYTITDKNGDGIDIREADFKCVSFNTSPDGSGTSYSLDSTFTPTENITLYAQWELK